MLDSCVARLTLNDDNASDSDCDSSSTKQGEKEHNLVYTLCKFSIDGKFIRYLTYRYLLFVYVLLLSCTDRVLDR